MKYHFVRSTREHPTLGNTLYINLFQEKICTLDCVWCSFGKTKLKTVERKNIVPIDDVVDEIQSIVRVIRRPESIFFLSRGESALHSEFGQLIKKIKGLYKKVKVGAWTNGTLFADKDVRMELALCDFLTVDLNVTNEEDFQKLHNPAKPIVFSDVVAGLQQFSKDFAGTLVISITFLKGFNDSEDNLANLRKQLEIITPTEINISLRKEKNTESLDVEFIELLKKEFDGLPYKITLEE